MSTPGTSTVSHHYVPEWYQRRFIDPAAHPHKLHYLDLSPERVVHPDGSFHYRRARRHLGPDNCFETDHLYTLRFGKHATDAIEKRFFGGIDQRGMKAVDFFSNYTLCDDAHDLFQPLLQYMDAQKWRTPKGLDLLRKMMGRDEHQIALLVLGRAFQLHCTIWTECVWEVLHCDNSPTKFIVSDHPVTTYNKGLFPGCPLCVYPLDAPIELLGTHSIFPLNLNRCLVLTNLGYVRNPWADPTKARTNARYFDQAMFDLRSVQTERQIDESHVLAINHVIKTRARRYIAAARTEWLYPEKQLERTTWNKLGGKYFLMPDPRHVKFHTQTLVGYKDGSAWGTDEYGRTRSRDDDPEVKRLRDLEWRTFQRWKQSWDSTFGELTTAQLRKYW